MGTWKASIAWDTSSIRSIVSTLKEVVCSACVVRILFSCIHDE